MLQLQAVLVVVFRLREGVSASVRIVELETKMQEVKVVREQVDSLKRKSVEEEPEFKYKSNKKQFKFNTDVKDEFTRF